jgi:hypothetical protein
MRSTLEPSVPSCCESASLSELTSAAGPIAHADRSPRRGSARMVRWNLRALP